MKCYRSRKAFRNGSGSENIFRRGAGRAHQPDNEELSVQPAGLGGKAAQDGRLLQAHGGGQRAQPGGVQVRLRGRVTDSVLRSASFI
jgi:hypothetical protein